MKKGILAITFIGVCVTCAFSQSGQFVQAPIIVQSGSTAKQAASLDEALNLAQDGDFIYLPGGDFYLGSPISKSVHIYGVGWRADSTAATGKTTIYPSITLNSGANNGSLNSVLVSGQGLIYNAQGQNLANYQISRCKAIKFNFRNTSANNLVLSVDNSVVFDLEFVAGSLNMNQCIIERNFLGSTEYSNVTPIPILTLTRCVLLHNDYKTPFTGFSSITMKNSIMFYGTNFGTNFYWAVSSAYLTDNLMVGENSLPGGTELYNIVKPTSFRSKVFDTYSGGVLVESSNLHVKADCPECVDKGIYSGANPYKDVPKNPYIKAQSVSVSPDGQSLQINFTVNKGAN